VLEGGLLRAEVASNNHLDTRFWMGTDETAQLSWSWQLPGAESDNWFQDVDVRDVDRLVADCVTVLRDVHGVLHPAFLLAGGLERAADDPVPDAPRAVPVRDDGGPVFPRSHDELVALVDAALADTTDNELVHDSDGDLPFPVGLSVLFVRVVEDRPAVELFAELVVDPAPTSRLAVELDILNRTHRLAKFYLSGTTVRMTHELVAWPFSAEQLRVVLRIMLDDVDTIAESLALRVDGKRFLEPPDVEEPVVEEPVAPVAELSTHPGMVALLELLHLGPVSSPAVGALFDHDRTAIIRHCTGIRLGHVSCGEHDEEQVLTALRRGLRHVVSGEVPERRQRPLPPRPRTEQGALVEDDEVGGADTLDLGWSA
jgi:hypothetical protein